MRNLTERISRFMYGRYGMDQLGRFLFILSIIFWVISLILRWTPFRKAAPFSSAAAASISSTSTAKASFSGPAAARRILPLWTGWISPPG